VGGAFPLRRPDRYATIPIMLPRGWDRRTIVLLTFAFLFVVATKLAQAQVFDLERDRVQMTELRGLMRFHTGDDPRWSDPDFDDSHWPLIPSCCSNWDVFSEQGYSGVAWYRFRVRLPRENGPFSILLGRVGSSYQVFSNGRLIGQMGRLPPREQPYFDAGHVYQLPEGGDPDKPVFIAIRVWCWRQWAGSGGIWEFPLAGKSDLLDGWLQKDHGQFLWDRSAENYQAAIQLMAGLAGLALFLLRRREREYLWFGIFELFAALKIILHTYIWVHSLPVKAYLASLDVATLAASLCFLAFLFYICGRHRTWLYWAVAAWALVDLGLLLSAVKEWIYLHTWWATVTIMEIPYVLFAFLLVIKGVRRGNPDARLLLIPVGLNFSVQLLTSGRSAVPWGWLSKVPWLRDTSASFLGTRSVLSWPFPITISELILTSIQFSILGILILRFARSRRDEERMTSELEAARAVQQVLIPEEIPAIPGFALECIYKPAGQVSGDFFQILPSSNNRALIVIGDVSGKGMPAAMAVSLLVGTVRTLVHYTQSPAEILSAMNQRMLARSKHGFTTCLVLRIDSDGTATAANAGHLAPYLGAQELPVDGGLPLGLVAEAVYTESSFQLDAGQELTLITDGVAEARAKTGELFGFERTASISILSAEHIAATAKAFGQEDDITVLKIRRCLVEERAFAVSTALPSISTNPA
jgi:hypothetical protein